MVENQFYAEGAVSRTLHQSSRYDPESLDFYEWPLSGLLDDDFRDTFNLNLSEDPVDVIIAIFTSISILLFADLVFRSTVRVRSESITSHDVYRRSLLLRFSNPLEWRSISKSLRLKQTVKQQGPPSTTGAGNVQRGAGENVFSFSMWQRVTIGMVGLVLIFFHLLSIFLATTSTRPVDVDKLSMPSFLIRDPKNTSLLLSNSGMCSIEPLTSKPGFAPSSTIMLCGVGNMFLTPENVSTTTASVIVQRVNSQLEVVVRTEQRFISYIHEVLVSIENGTQYKTMSDAKPEDARSVIPVVYSRHGIFTLFVSSKDVKNVSQTEDWVEQFELNVTNIDPPDAIWARYNLTTQAAPWLDAQRMAMNRYLSSIALSSFSLTGRSRAYNQRTTGPFLDEFDGALLYLNRPRLTVVGCLVLCGVLFVMWVSVAFILGWHSGVDERVIWLHKFSNLHSIHDYRKMPNEVVQDP